MIENSVIIDAVNQEIRVTVVTEAPEAFVDRVKEGHLVKYAKNIHKKLHLPHNIELTHDGDLKVSVYFKKPLSIGGIVSITAAISDMANVVIDSVMAAPRFNAAIGYINSLEPKKLEKDPKPEESDESDEYEEM
jgi:hypothetical protein